MTSPYCTLEQAKRLAAMGFKCEHSKAWLKVSASILPPAHAHKSIPCLMDVPLGVLYQGEGRVEYLHPAPIAEQIIMAMPRKILFCGFYCRLIIRHDFIYYEKGSFYNYNTENRAIEIKHNGDLKEACIQLLEKLHQLGIPLQ